jgi:hypothetical protein
VCYAQVLNRTVMLSLLFATQPWWAAVYLGGDFLLLVVYKAARRDLLHWGPGFGVPLSLLTRFAVKVFSDSTACVSPGARRPVLHPQRRARPGMAPFAHAYDAVPHAPFDMYT